AESEPRFEAAVRAYQAAVVKPLLPEAAHRYEVQAEDAVRHNQLGDAADLYEQATEAAPWWPAAHYDRALVLANTQDYDDAVMEMKHYLVLVPDAPNARAARDQMYIWEHRATLDASTGTSSAGAPSCCTGSMAGNPVPLTAVAGKRLAIQVVSQCPPDPDPIGIINSNFYSKCAQNELNQIQGWVTSALISKNVFTSIGSANPDLILTITMTKDMMDFGAAGFLTSLAPGRLKFAANYQLADTNSNVLESGTASYEGGLGEGNMSGRAATNVEQRFAASIADKIAASIASDNATDTLLPQQQQTKEQLLGKQQGRHSSHKLSLTDVKPASNLQLMTGDGPMPK
ncbi:MAG: hypothetical protein ACYDDO_07280, partial [Acidiferrobacterales bacterium]